MLVANSRGPAVRLVMVAAAIGLFMVGYYWGNRYKHGDPAPLSIEGVLVRPPLELPGVELQDARGQAFTTDSFKDRWTLLTFADPGRAPGHLAITRMIEIQNRLAASPELQARLQLALVAESRDPALAQDFGRLSTALKLLSGVPGEVRKLRVSVGASPRNDVGAEVEGDPAFFLIDPSGRLQSFFPGTQPPASIASDLSAIAEHPQLAHPSNE